MNKHWENLMLDDDRPRKYRTPTHPVGPAGIAPRRYPDNYDQGTGADLESRCRLSITDPGRTIGAEYLMFDDG
jgi:hypothetical protein